VRLVVFTGVSGSGRSSLAFDTLYAEGQRRYVESLSSYARQFLGQMEKPKYEQLRGLSPAIAIEQKSASSNPRSTVGTVTEIYDYLRVLYARAGEQRRHLVGALLELALGGGQFAPEELALDTATDGGGDPRDVLVAGRGRRVEDRLRASREAVDAVEKEGMEVRARIGHGLAAVSFVAVASGAWFDHEVASALRPTSDGAVRPHRRGRDRQQAPSAARSSGRVANYHDK
jgi:hypothetical protein